jgi:G:T-mismatch repair DNA endonuclease (very short patch repair protein)
MSKIRNKDTQIELDFQKDFPSAIPHPDFLPYRPDFVLREGKVRLVIFLDSTFWHGFVSVEKLVRFPTFWRDKIYRNIMTDFAAITFWRVVQDEVGFIVLMRKGVRTWDEVVSTVS